MENDLYYTWYDIHLFYISSIFFYFHVTSCHFLIKICSKKSMIDNLLDILHNFTFPTIFFLKD